MNGEPSLGCHLLSIYFCCESSRGRGLVAGCSCIFPLSVSDLSYVARVRVRSVEAQYPEQQYRPSHRTHPGLPTSAAVNRYLLFSNRYSDVHWYTQYS